jgi:hypothetical protein
LFPQSNNLQAKELHSFIGPLQLEVNTYENLEVETCAGNIQVLQKTLAEALKTGCGLSIKKQQSCINTILCDLKNFLGVDSFLQTSAFIWRNW